MSDRKFERGQVVYDQWGNKADYIEHSPRGHLVYPHGRYKGQPERWPREAWLEAYATNPLTFKAWSWAVAVLIVAAFWGYVLS